MHMCMHMYMYWTAMHQVSVCHARTLTHAGVAMRRSASG